jgi:hypothetical protein
MKRVIAGRYRLVELVGRGGMGAVWRARDELLDRDVAVKEVLSPPGLSETAEADLYRRAMREARSAARLSHPSVVTVHDVASEEGRPWVVMELLDARSLQDVLDASGPLSPARAAYIGRQILEALTAAHAVGILHRDVKPANVLVAEGDRVILTDFGIAAIEGEEAITRTGGLIGSPAYIAPERVRGLPASAASDLWALGVTLYAAVEGRLPFHHTDPVAVFGALLTHEPQPPANAGPLRPVIEGLLAKDPDKRLTAAAAKGMFGRAEATSVDVPWTPEPKPKPRGALVEWIAAAGGAVVLAAVALAAMMAVRADPKWPDLAFLELAALLPLAQIPLMLSVHRRSRSTLSWSVLVVGAAGACVHLLVLVHEAKYGTDWTRWNQDDPQGPLVGYGLITAAWIMMTGLVVRTRTALALGLAAGIGWACLFGVDVPASAFLVLLIPVPLAYAAWSAVIVGSER